MNISIVDFSTRYNVGKAGDHNANTIDVTIPAELLALNPDYYVLHFLTADYQSISTGNLTAVDGVISTPIWNELTVAGILKMRVGAYDYTGAELTTAGYSAVCLLAVGEGIPDGIDGNTEYQGLMSDLQEALTAVEGATTDAETATGEAVTAKNNAELATTAANTAAQAATPLIVNTNTNLPTTAADGKEVIAREISQTFPWVLKNIDSTLGYGTPVLVSAQQKGVYIKKTPPKPDFTALGISPQALISGWSTVFGNVAPYKLSGSTNYLHWHTGMHVDLYNMFFLPAGLFVLVDILVFADLMWDCGNPDGEDGRIKYFYIWETLPADPEDPESVPHQAGWHEVTEWDEDNNISNLIDIPEMPDIRMSCSARFEDNATGLKTAEYFATVCNDRPFTYRRYLRDNGTWVLLN